MCAVGVRRLIWLHAVLLPTKATAASEVLSSLPPFFCFLDGAAFDCLDVF